MSHERVTTSLSRRARALALLLAALFGPAQVHADELEGTVSDSLGAPVPTVDLDVFASDGTLLPADDNTDADGTYRVTLAAGRYDVVFEPPVGAGLAPRRIRGVNVSGTTRMDLTLPPGQRLLGWVRDAAGLAVSGADLDFDRSDDGSRTPVLGDITTRFGSFAAIVERGRYTITVFPPAGSALAPIRLRDVDVPRGDTLALVLPVASRLSTRVRGSDGTDLAGARLRFERELDGVRMPSVDDVTGVDGRCEPGVAPGRYRVLVLPARGSRWVAQRGAVIDLTEDAALDAELAAGLVLSGTVFDDTGLPLPGADFDVADATTGSSVVVGDDRTDADGRFALVLPSGTFRLLITPPSGLGLAPRTLEGVVVTADTAFDVDLSDGTTDRPGLAFAAVGSPARGGATFRLVLARAESDVAVELFDASGRFVRALHRGALASGAHTLAWDGRRDQGADAHTGIYFARVRMAGETRARARCIVLPR